MIYLKRSEVAEKYRVSLKTVHNWINSAKEGKIDLKLHEEGNKTYIANDPATLVVLESLAEQGRKKRNTRFHKVITPDHRFYELLTRKQVVDIIQNLKTHREIPRQYNYIDQGAVNWDKYTRRLWNEDAPNLLKNTVDLLHANLGSIDLLLEGHSRVNVIDLGPGNALPVRELLRHLLDRGLLHRYIAVDISEEMLRIAKRNINAWFGDEIKFEGYIRDLSYERFDDVLLDDILAKDADKTINLALLLGATPMNLRDPQSLLRTIHGSLGREDLLVYTDKPDSEAERRYFNFNVQSDSVQALSPTHRYIFDLLNIDESLYVVEMGFNEQRRVRYVSVRLKMALTIKFKFRGGEHSVHLDKGDTILLLRVWHMSALEIITDFEEVGFGLLQSSLTKDREYLLTISGLHTGPDFENSPLV